MAEVRKWNVGVDLNGRQASLCWYEPATDMGAAAALKKGNEALSFQDVLEELAIMEELGEFEAGAAADETAVRDRAALSERAASILADGLAMLGAADIPAQVLTLALAVPHMTRGMIWLARDLFARLGLPRERCQLLGYREALYYHTLFQKTELWNRNVGYFRFEEGEASFVSLKFDRLTRPVTVQAEDGPHITLRDDPAAWDEQLANFIAASVRQNAYSCLFLASGVFDPKRDRRAAAALTRSGRKAFLVDYLFARGACCAARERLAARRSENYLYMGPDLVRTNLGMQMVVQGKETYYPLISAGVNWYDAACSVTCILEDADELLFLQKPIDGGRQRTYRMPLAGLAAQDRPRRTVRLEVHLICESPEVCRVEVKDAGFGALVPGKGKVWTDELHM